MNHFFGKIGEKSKVCNKKIANKVLIITRNGKIKQFRLLSICTLNIIKIKSNFSNKTFENNLNDEILCKKVNSFIYDTNKDNWKNILFDLNNPCAWLYDVTFIGDEDSDKINIKYKKNPNKNIKPDKSKLSRAKDWLIYAYSHKNELNKYTNVNRKDYDLRKYSFFIDNLDIRPELAWLVSEDPKLDKNNYVLDLFDFEEDVKYLNSIDKLNNISDNNNPFYLGGN